MAMPDDDDLPVVMPPAVIAMHPAVIAMHFGTRAEVMMVAVTFRLWSCGRV
jgi:hypothetical protein